MTIYYEFDIEMFDLEYGDIQDHEFFGMFQGGKQTDKSYQPYIKDFKEFDCGNVIPKYVASAFQKLKEGAK